jgi:hypothetical protein
MSDSFFSSHWYRVQQLRPALRNHVRTHRHHYRGERWYVLEDRVSGRQHRFPSPRGALWPVSAGGWSAWRSSLFTSEASSRTRPALLGRTL